MESLINFISDYSIEFIIGLLGICTLLLILNIVSNVRISKITKKYNRLVRGAESNTIENMLLEHLNKVENVQEELNVLDKFTKELDEKLKKSIRKVGIVRFNAFDNMGSNLSFSAALLDDNLNGFVLTSLYGRNESNTYGKPIVNGKSKYDLSEEEIEAIDKAIKS